MMTQGLSGAGGVAMSELCSQSIVDPQLRSWDVEPESGATERSGTAPRRRACAANRKLDRNDSGGVPNGRYRPRDTYEHPTALCPLPLAPPSRPAGRTPPTERAAQPRWDLGGGEAAHSQSATYSAQRSEQPAQRAASAACGRARGRSSRRRRRRGGRSPPASSPPLLRRAATAAWGRGAGGSRAPRPTRRRSHRRACA